MRLCARRCWLLVILALLVGPGCVYNKSPLSDASSSQPDQRLLGTWEVADPEEPTEKDTVVVSLSKDQPKVLQAVASKGDVREEMELYTIQIGSDWYLSTLDKNKDGQRRYAIARYELTKDQLKLFPFDVRYFSEAVEKQLLPGTIAQQQLLKDVNLEASPEVLAAFLKEHKADCFKKEVIELAVKQLKAPEPTKPAAAVTTTKVPAKH